MGWKEMLSSALGTGENGQDAGLTNGLFGKGYFSEQINKIKEQQNRQRPGKMCTISCKVDDERCTECLKEQQAILDGIVELQNLERNVELANTQPQVLKKSKITKCSLCSAPFEKGEKKCPYCDTPYPVDALSADIPETKIEQNQLMLEKANEVFGLYSALYAKQADYSINKDAVPGLLKGFIDISMSIGTNTMKMTAPQIQRGANEYGVSYSEYISGIIAGTYKTIPKIQQEKLLEANRQMQEQNRQIDAQAQAKLRQLNQEKMNIQSRMFTHNTTQYSGGSDRTCYNCTYYSAGAGRCASTGRTTNAGDYCGRHKWK